MISRVPKNDYAWIVLKTLKIFTMECFSIYLFLQLPVDNLLWLCTAVSIEVRVTWSARNCNWLRWSRHTKLLLGLATLVQFHLRRKYKITFADSSFLNWCHLTIIHVQKLNENKCHEPMAQNTLSLFPNLHVEERDQAGQVVASYIRSDSDGRIDVIVRLCSSGDRGDIF